MDLQIRGRRAFVSGSSSGIGRGIALKLAEEGCDVAVHGRNKARTEETAHEVEKHGVKAVVTLGDLAEADGCDTVAKAALDGLGGMEIVVNNAGIALCKDNPDWSVIPWDTWEASFQVNFMSTLRISQLMLPAIVDAGYGRFINISTAGSIVTPMLTEYGAAKAALNKLTADMAKSVGKYNATANGILPGIVMSAAIEEYLDVFAGQMGWTGTTEEIGKKWVAEISRQPVARVGTPEDCANLAAFFASPASGYISGVTVKIDGGSNGSVY